MATEESAERIKVGKLIIAREDLERIQALVRAKAQEKERRALPEAADPLAGLPPRVRAFWLQEDRDTPPWRLESDEARAQRERLTELGGWCG